MSPRGLPAGLYGADALYGARRERRDAPACRSARGAERGPEAVEVGAAEDDAVARRDVDEVDVHARVRDAAREVGEHARPVLDVDRDHLALARHDEVRDPERVLRGL